MICPNCKSDNNANNKFCSLCGTELNSNQVIVDNVVEEPVMSSSPGISVKTIKKINIIINIFLVGPFLFAGLAFFCVGLFSTISEHNKTKGYEKTIAYYKDSINCEEEYDDEGYEVYCEALYEYKVDGETYTVIPAEYGDPYDFSDTETVYYDPSNPSESIIYADWSFLAIVGVFLLIFSIGSIVVKNIILKKIVGDRKEINIEDFVGA